ncbi:NAD(P)+ transhydrogenase beta chain [Brucella anthropi]|uniref:NAD(P)+ transhydrogenase beta chain n=1 Tax=Brucella anthropi TaxID=529 RepID=UPI00244CABBE|nr:NAD(P)+ transhydrogenase beta chain [Brucella anthropi]MDG9793760.1 NAD(P)+ transhydrogenase beta chain [Brucella anthropi]MDH0583645.1 NAD(P)+ transhydrogenase beta chain [Brucella anthropi]MDH0820169.1 NAD(P)+ transhydrogenase beta chain [Brucella anthropi]MDH2087002.1 NAD(P)+ transhydrogenase beta chain [Brucella anthropi]
MSEPIKEPGYRSTRRYLWGSFYLAWAVILILVGAASIGSEQAVAIAPIVVPSMVALIVGVLGVHRGFGSVDFRSQTLAQSPDPRGGRP